MTRHPGTGAAGELPVSVREPVETRAAEGEIPPRASRRVPRQVSAGELAENRASQVEAVVGHASHGE